MSTATAELLRLRIALGTDATGMFDAGLPVLAGEAVENLFGAAEPAGRVGDLSLFRAERWLLGAASLPLTGGLEEVSRRLYGSIFAATRGYHLARIWNYVPAINEPGPSGLENYRVFCRGRSVAFEQSYGSGFNSRLPSASAVGCKSAALTVAFAACSNLPRHVENPRQISAYHYPGVYGPRAPCFARATVAPGKEDAAVFISGTASIRGHATVAPHDVPGQVECLLENFQTISVACGLGPNLDAGGPSTRHFKIYLRNAGDQPLVATLLNEQLLTRPDHVTYLEADICRAELLVEIEASLFGVKRTG